MPANHLRDITVYNKLGTWDEVNTDVLTNKVKELYGSEMAREIWVVELQVYMLEHKEIHPNAFSSCTRS